MTEERRPTTDSPRRRRSPRHIRITRDGILFVLGIGIVLHELILQDQVRAEWLVVATTLMGAVPYLQKGDKERDKRGEDDGGA